MKSGKRHMSDRMELPNQVKSWNPGENETYKYLGFLEADRSEGHPNYGIVENGQNTEKISGDLRRLAVTQTLVKNHYLNLMWKPLKD